MTQTVESSALRAMTTDIVAAYVSKNHLPAAEVPGLVITVHRTLTGLAQVRPAAEEEPQLTAAEIRKSIRPDGLVSFIDGRAYKTLKRHLRGHNLTPEAYREQFGLPSDYPMTAPSYSARRSELAKLLGLGQRTVA